MADATVRVVTRKEDERRQSETQRTERRNMIPTLGILQGITSYHGFYALLAILLHS